MTREGARLDALPDRAAIERPRIDRAAPPGRDYLFSRLHRHAVDPATLRVEAVTALKARLRPGPAKERRFLIFGRARSGTTLLSNLLDQLPDTYVDGELLGRGRLVPRGYTRACERTAPRRNYGFKLLSYQLAVIQRVRDPEAFLRSYIADGYAIIHVERDTLGQALSIARASESGTFHVKADGNGQDRPGQSTATVDVSNFMARLRWNVKLLSFERALMDRLPHQRVSYEADLADPARHQPMADRLADAIGLERGPVRAGMRKVLPSRLDDIATNADELRAAVKDAGLSMVLDGASRAGA